MYKLAYALIEDSGQPARMRRLIRVLDGRSMGSQVSNISQGGKLRLWSECVDAQSDSNLRYTHVPACTLCWTPASAQSIKRSWINFIWIKSKDLHLIVTGSKLFRRALTLSSRFVFKDDIANVNYDRPTTAASKWILALLFKFQLWFDHRCFWFGNGFSVKWASMK